MKCLFSHRGSIPALALLVGLLALSSCQKSWDDRCEEEARRITREHCPETILQDRILMDSMTYDRKTETMSYHYRVTGSMDYDSLFVPSRKDEYEKALVRSVINATDLEAYKRRGMSFEYIYTSSSSGKEYLRVLVAPEEYDMLKNKAEE